jgi:hypothetical protein
MTLMMMSLFSLQAGHLTSTGDPGTTSKMLSNDSLLRTIGCKCVSLVKAMGAEFAYVPTPRAMPN